MHEPALTALPFRIAKEIDKREREREGGRDWHRLSGGQMQKRRMKSWSRKPVFMVKKHGKNRALK